MKKHISKIILIIIALFVAFLYISNVNFQPQQSLKPVAVEEAKKDLSEKAIETEENNNPAKTENINTEIETKTETNNTSNATIETDEQPNNIPQIAETTCTLSVRCDTILNNIEKLNKAKADIIPQNGIIFAERAVKLNEGESVFDLLLREMKQNNIHFEFVNTPIYNSAYIKGIANIYEYDCGELSGWKYKVNGVFPDYGCSQYKLKPYDKVEIVYTCDLGRDIGGNSF